MFTLIHKLQDSIKNKNFIDNIKYIQNFDYNNSGYVSTKFSEIGNINLFNIVTKPKNNSDPKTIEELKDIAKFTKTRSKEDISLIHDADKDPLLVFRKFLLDKYNLKFNYDLFTVMYNNSVLEITEHLKYYYNRARPYQIAEYYNINIDRIITKTHKTPSYPSGHTMYSALAAKILLDNYPDKRKEINQVVSLCAKARVLQGVHFPSDNIASIKIINTIYPALKKYYGELNEL